MSITKNDNSNSCMLVHIFMRPYLMPRTLFSLLSLCLWLAPCPHSCPCAWHCLNSFTFIFSNDFSGNTIRIRCTAFLISSLSFLTTCLLIWEAQISTTLPLHLCCKWRITITVTLTLFYIQTSFAFLSSSVVLWCSSVT